MHSMIVAPHQDFELAEDALEGEPEAMAIVLEILRAPELRAALTSRGASPTEADDIIGDITGDCFGGERAKGGLHRLLGRYNGGCPLSAYFRHIATNRLISIKRKRKPTVSTDDEDTRELPGASVTPTDDALISLLRDALVVSLGRVDPEKLVLIRLIESYQIPQKQVGSLLGWHESKISRLKSDFLAELRTLVTEEIRKADPWLHLEWEDFLGLCAESVDLFAI